MVMSTLAIGIVGSVAALLVLFLWNFLVNKTNKVSGEWKAEIYTVSKATKKGSSFVGRDLKLHSVDKLRKVELKGSVIYSLVSLGKTTPAVTNDCEETIAYDGKNPLKRVRVLLEGDSCTLLEMSYVDDLVVFQPIAYDKNNQIQNDIQLHESRHQKKESFWNQIAPFLNIMIVCLMVIICTMLIGNTQAKISVENTAQLDINSFTQQVVSENIAIANLIANGFSPEDLNVLQDNIDAIKELQSLSEGGLGKQSGVVSSGNNTVESIE